MADENVTEDEETPVAEPEAEVPAADEPVAEAPEAAAETVAAAEEAVEEPAEVAAAAGEAEAPAAEEAVEAPEAAAAPPAGPKPKKKRLPRSQRPARSKPVREKPATRRPIVRLEKPEHERGRRQERQGTVVSDGMEKTIVVKVDVVKAHPKYKKVVRRSVKFHAHDERSEAKVGDIVRIVETRPLSKTKRWRLAEVVEAAK